jgi:RNA polymerase sigma-70 factor (ECF subfamily)
VNEAQQIAAELETHRRFLLGLSYRLTGSAADAEDIVQETFRRAIERPPPDRGRPLAPWLVRVATNLGRDLLRHRKRRGYVGPWLPSPIETELWSVEAELGEGRTTEGRYDLLESVSFAFLLALEALTPRQRAVLLLREVFDYSVAEAAAALGMSEANVKTTHHRAREAMRTYDAERCAPTLEHRERTQATLLEFMQHLAAQDVPAIESMLAASVVALSDGGGKYLAARVPVHGPRKVAKLFAKLTLLSLKKEAQVEFRVLNGLPAIVVRLPEHRRGPREAPMSVTLIEVDAGGRIRALHSVLDDAKLAGLSAPS